MVERQETAPEAESGATTEPAPAAAPAGTSSPAIPAPEPPTAPLGPAAEPTTAPVPPAAEPATAPLTPAAEPTTAPVPPAAEPTAGEPTTAAASAWPAGAATAAAVAPRRPLPARMASGALRAARASGRATLRAGRSTNAWAKRPIGRLVVPAAVTVLLLATAGTTGAYLVPNALVVGKPQTTETASAAAGGLTAGAPGPAQPAPSLSAGAPAPGGAQPTASGSAAPIGPGSGRPAEALSGWAEQIAPRVGIPIVAVEAYGYAELVIDRTAPTCNLSWTTIAALGQVESNHGSAGGSTLGPDGMVTPPIYGLPLDGKGGRQLIRDTDQGVIDGDTTYDRAVGPLQFIPATWRANAIDADNNGTADPNDIDDAALTAASYLCQGGRSMSSPDAWWAAILSYNMVRPYAQKVYEVANRYGQLSRS